MASPGAGHDYLAPEWKELLARHGLGCFEDVWQFQSAWFETPNQRRGGWSGVTRFVLEPPSGSPKAVFLKRQENHFTKTWRHPWRGIATLRREFENLQRLAAAGLPGPKAIYFAWRKAPRHVRAILVTEELEGFRSLDQCVEDWTRLGWPDRKQRRAILEAVAQSVRQLHALGLQHNCLYPKHIFIRGHETTAPAASTGDAIEVRLIDLEKAKPAWSPWRAVRRDLDSLNRHAPGWPMKDRLQFLKAYLQIPRLGPWKRWWRKLARRSSRKQHASSTRV